jgi:hypothetical protein
MDLFDTLTFAEIQVRTTFLDTLSLTVPTCLLCLVVKVEFRLLHFHIQVDLHIQLVDNDAI